jgi:predicted Zn-dependent protease
VAKRSRVLEAAYGKVFMLKQQHRSMVFEGLYDKETGLCHDGEEVAFVIAHELAHVNCRHSTEQMSTIMAAQAMAELTAALVEEADEPEWAEVVRAAFAVGSALFVPKYDRKQELEADRVGMMYMAKAGYDPRAGIRIWKRISLKTGEGESVGLMGIMDSHPTSTKRYRELEANLPAAMELYKERTGHYPEGYTHTTL